MIDHHLEQRLLEVAVTEGLVTHDRVQTVCAEVDDWGAVVSSLVRDGTLPREWARQTLEAIDGTPTPAGSPSGATEDTAVPDGADWRYERRELLGEGGMGRVYKAWDRRLRRFVALKLLRSGDPEQEARFLREARAQARIDHPNVCKVFETGVLDGRSFIAMQLVEGFPLSAAQDRSHRPAKALREMTVEQKVKVIRQVAEGIHAAHREGLIHRDIKPSNILVERTDSGEDRPTVVDFGLARDMAAAGVTSLGLAAGTPHFMAPEQARGESGSLDRRTDVYGLGATLYALLAGHPPFEGKSSLDVLVKVTEEETPPLPDVPRDLAVIVGKCLEKEPARRYDSARQLAEELGRYVDGEPILARGSSLGYRLLKRARKHRALVAVGSAALVSLTVLGALSARAELRSRERARLAQSFGREVATIEGLMRLAHLSRRHDLTPHKVAIRGRMEALAERVSELGEIAEGPGSYALGRGHLALGELDAAQRQLEGAWETGYREPEVAYALAQTLSSRYREELLEAERIRNAARREKRKREIEHDLREPALEFAALSQGVEVDSPELLAAQVAFLEERYDAALEAAREAAEQLPWLYEARLLEGEVMRALMRDSDRTGEAGEATAAYTAAAVAFATALEQGNSDPRGHEAVCRLHLDRMEMEMYGEGGDVAPYFEQGLQACEHATAVDPERPLPHVLRAGIFLRMGEYELRHGQDPRGNAALAVEAAETALLAAPRSEAALNKIGGAHWITASYERSRGRSSREALAKAAAAFERATDINPNAAFLLNNLGIVHRNLAVADNLEGEDPMPSISRALRAFDEAIAVDPEYSAAYLNHGNALLLQATSMTERGERPQEALLAGAASYRSALALRPSAPIYNSLGAAHLMLASDHELRGEPVEETLRQAAQAFEKALELSPDYAAALQNLGEVHASRAREAFRKGEDPAVHLRASDDLFRRSLELNPNATDVSLVLAENHLLRAEHRLASDEDPASELAAAAATLERALEVNPKHLGLTLAQAQRERLSSRATLAGGGDPLPSLRRAADWAQKALAINPQASTAHRELGWVSTLEAGRSIARGESPEAPLVSALASLDQALAIKSDDALSHRLRAEALRQRSDWRRRQGKPAPADLEEALAAIDRALTLRPRDAEALVTRAAILCQRAMAVDGEARAATAAAAHQALDEALAVSPFVAAEAAIVAAALRDIPPGGRRSPDRPSAS